jgi:hypothetical protein
LSRVQIYAPEPATSCQKKLINSYKNRQTTKGPPLHNKHLSIFFETTTLRDRLGNILPVHQLGSLVPDTLKPVNIPQIQQVHVKHFGTNVVAPNLHYTNRLIKLKPRVQPSNLLHERFYRIIKTWVKKNTPQTEVTSTIIALGGGA